MILTTTNQARLGVHLVESAKPLCLRRARETFLSQMFGLRYWRMPS